MNKVQKLEKVEEQQSRGAYNTCCSQGGVETFGAAVPVTTVGLYLVQLFDSVPGTAVVDLCCTQVWRHFEAGLRFEWFTAGTGGCQSQLQLDLEPFPSNWSKQATTRSEKQPGLSKKERSLQGLRGCKAMAAWPRSSTRCILTTFDCTAVLFNPRSSVSEM